MSKILDVVLNKTEEKYMAGVKEHGGQMDDAQISMEDWLACLQEEAIDTVFYCEKILTMLKDQKEAGCRQPLKWPYNWLSLLRGKL